MKKGRWVTSDYKPGVVLLFDFGHDGDPDHVGIFDHYEAGKLVSIEGNTSITSNDHGGAVMERSRAKSVIIGAYMPEYTEEGHTMDNSPSEWAAEAVAWAKDAGLSSSSTRTLPGSGCACCCTGILNYRLFAV